jgi:hypothetical protein
VIIVSGSNTNNINSLFDISTGAGGAEVDVIPNLPVTHQGASSANQTRGQWTIPLAIASSTRLASRMQATTGASTLEIAVELMGASNASPGITSFTTSGISTGTSLGTSIDPGGTADTKGSYAQIVASTAAVYQWIGALVHNVGSTSPIGARWAMDVSTGAGGSEVVLIADLRLLQVSTSFGSLPAMWGFLTYIAASTRIAIRASCSSNTATSRLFNAGVVGGTGPAEGGYLVVA